MGEKVAPFASISSIWIAVFADVGWIAFKHVFVLRRFISDPDGVEALDMALRVLAGELVLGGLAVVVAVVALARREGRWAQVALGLSIASMVARAAFM